MKRYLLLTSATLPLASGLALAAPGGRQVLPNEAVQVIQQVGAAAQRKDFSALRSLMIQEFTWSFGGDGDSEQAIEAWKHRPAALASLSRAARGQCGFVSSELIQCPMNAGLAYRAGFKRIANTWKMVYFVEGD